MVSTIDPRTGINTYLKVSCGNRKYIVEVQAVGYMDSFSVTDGIRVWANDSVLKNSATKHRLIVALRRNVATVSLLPRKNPLSDGVNIFEQDIVVKLSKPGDEFTCARVAAEGEAVKLQAIVEGMSDSLECCHYELKWLHNDPTVEMNLILQPDANRTDLGYSAFKKTARKREHAADRPGMSLINPHSRKRKPARGVVFEDDSD